MATQKANFNAARQQAKPLTPEEQQEQIRRAVMQKKASLAEGILFNLCQNPALFKTEAPLTFYGIEAVKTANDMATEFMKVVYGQEIVFKEEE